MPTTPQKKLKITDAPGGDSKIIADNYAADATNAVYDDAGSTDSKTSPYSLINRNRAPNSADYNAASPNYAASSNSLIESKLKRKIDPRSMIKLKNDADAVVNNASHDAINTAPHAPNSANPADTENKTYVRQLLDGK